MYSRSNKFKQRLKYQIMVIHAHTKVNVQTHIIYVYTVCLTHL